MPQPLVARLSALGLLSKTPERGGENLLALCDEGVLDGGLGVALDVRPDELFGPLLLRVGGGAARLRVLDVRDVDGATELRVRLGDREEAWQVASNTELVAQVNRAFEGDRSARAVALLGEWEDMLQLWCVPKDKLGRLLAERAFAPENRAQLRALR